MAFLKRIGNPRQHNPRASAAEIARTQPGRNNLAVHARQLALKPRLQIIQRYHRPLLLRMEPTHRPAMEDYVYRVEKLGAPMILYGN